MPKIFDQNISKQTLQNKPTVVSYNYNFYNFNKGDTNMKKWVCNVCGYVHEGEEAPEVCPLCGVGAEDFREEE